jgi:hypothetical protein
VHAAFTHVLLVAPLLTQCGCGVAAVVIVQGQAAAAANGPGSSKQAVPGVFMSPPFVPSMLDPIVAAFSPHRAQQQQEAKNKSVSYAAASRTRLTRLQVRLQRHENELSPCIWLAERARGAIGHAGRGGW